MTAGQAVAYRCAPEVVWVKDASRTILVESTGGRGWSLDGLEAVIWDLLTLGYAYERIAHLVAVMQDRPVREARELLLSVIRDWEQSGILCGRDGSTPPPITSLARDRRKESAVTGAAVSTVVNQSRIPYFPADRLFADCDRTSPALPSRFLELLKRSSAAGEQVRILSTGRIPAQTLACLEALPTHLCTVLVEVHEPGDDLASRAYWRQVDILRHLGRRAMPAFRILHTSFAPEFLLSIVAETGCKPAIHLSMAQPTLAAGSRFIHPNQYRGVGLRIADFARLAADVGVEIEFGCGFVRCMFSDAELKTLGTGAGWHCNPILDIDVDGCISPCPALGQHESSPLTPATGTPALGAQFEAWAGPYRRAGVFAECSTCPFKSAGECTGGCLVTTIRRFRHTPFSLQVPGPGEVAA